MISLPRIAPVVLGLIIFEAAITPACAQQEFSPPQGKGRVVVVVSGHDGAATYRGFAAQIAQLGYDAVLFDANNLAENESPALRTAIEQAQRVPHAITGKVGLVGLSNWSPIRTRSMASYSAASITTPGPMQMRCSARQPSWPNISAASATRLNRTNRGPAGTAAIRVCCLPRL